jgi:hypothetical protein
MLVPNLRPKVVPHGPRLLPRLIVRIGGRLVAGCPWAGPAPPGSSGSAHGSGGHHLGDPGPVAALQKREGLLALRFFSPALLLPEALCSQGQLNRRVRALEPELRALQRSLAEELSHPSAVYRVMDTTLIPAIVRVRASRKGHFFCGQATFGRSASKTEWVYGFKVALVVDPGGVITAFFLAAASSDERPIGDALVASDRHEAYLWQTKGLRVWSGSGAGWRSTGRWLPPPPTTTPAGRGRRPIVVGLASLGKRQIIEGVICQLKDFFSVERHRAKTLGGLLARLTAKVAAYTCAQRVNASLGRPLRHLADLLI